MAERGGHWPPFRELAEPVAALTRQIVRRRGFAHPLLFRHWPDIVGAEIARHALPEQVVYPPRRRSGGTLVVRIDSPSLAVEVQHAAPAIIEAFNLHAGFASIAAIRLRHGPLPHLPAAPPPAAPPPAGGPTVADSAALAAVDDPQLRAALRDLGAAIARRAGNG